MNLISQFYFFIVSAELRVRSKRNSEFYQEHKHDCISSFTNDLTDEIVAAYNTGYNKQKPVADPANVLTWVKPLTKKIKNLYGFQGGIELWL